MGVIHTLIMELGMLTQDPKFEASLDYIVIPCIKN
jgi:hypothetical protein